VGFGSRLTAGSAQPADGRHTGPVKERDLAPLVDRIPEGVLAAALPTPFPVGPVNCYLLPGDPVTVVDPGMVTPESIAALQSLLAAASLETADVDQILVTHGHPDHYGAAGWVAERSGARILCGAAEAPKLLGAPRPTYDRLLLDLGMPARMVVEAGTMRKAVRDLVRTPDPAMLFHLVDGDRLTAGGREWSVLETPGHAVGHLSLHEPDGDVLLSGDHLLPRITPNPVLEPDDAPPGRRHSLIEYLGSLGRFAGLDPAVVLPGHGPPFTDVPQLVERVRAHHADRGDRILSLVARLGSPTPYDVAMQLFPGLKGFGVMLGVSEVIGHLDLLASDGRVRQVDESPVRFVPAGVAARASS